MWPLHITAFPELHGLPYPIEPTALVLKLDLQDIHRDKSVIRIRFVLIKYGDLE